MSPLLPLHGLKVLDLSRIVAGPYAAMLLADLGATVLKVESPHDPDAARGWGPPLIREELAPHFALGNRGKALTMLDLGSNAGRRQLEALIAAADVVIENFKAGSLYRLGVDREALLEQHPGLVWASITGYGATGPLAARAGYDGIAQAASGLMSLSGTAESGPVKMASPVADQSTALFLTVGILAKLQDRARSGRGGLVEANLFASALALAGPYAVAELHGQQAPRQVGNGNAFISPFGCYPCAQGTHLMLTVGSDAQFITMAKLLMLPDADAIKFATQAARLRAPASLDELIVSGLSTALAHDWEVRLGTVGIACSVVRTVGEALAHPQAQALGLVRDQQLSTPVFLDGAPLMAAGAPPRLRDALSMQDALAYFTEPQSA